MSDAKVALVDIVDRVLDTYNTNEMLRIQAQLVKFH